MRDPHAGCRARTNDEAEKIAAMAAFARSDVACPFGPSFSSGQLGRFVRDRCPDPNEHLPVVQLNRSVDKSLGDESDRALLPFNCGPTRVL